MQAKSKLIYSFLLCLPLLGSALQGQEKGQVFVEQSHVEDRLKVAQRAIEIKNWDALLDIYMEILEHYPNEVYNPPGKKRFYVGISNYIYESILKLPQDVLKLFRLRYDGKAKAIFKEGKSKRNLGLIEKGIHKYFFASSSDEAMFYLANIYIQQGRFSEAAFHLQNLLRYPDSEIPQEIVLAKLAIAYVLSLNKTGLERIKQITSEKLIYVGKNKIALSKFIKDLHIRSVSKDLIPYILETPQEVVKHTLFSDHILEWKRDDMKGIYGDPSRAPYPLRYPRERNPIPDYPYFPTMDHHQKKVFCQDGFTIYAISTTTGKLKWNFRLTRQRPHRISRNYGALYGCATDGKYVFANIHPHKDFPRRQPGRRYGYPPTPVPTVLVCINARNGKLCWRSDDPSIAIKEEEELGFASWPLIKGNRLYVTKASISRGEKGTWVYCIDKHTGKTIWRTFVSALSIHLHRHFTGSTLEFVPLLLEHNGILYCQTNMGTIAAINSTRGDIIWIVKYKNASTHPLRPPNFPVIHEDSLFFLPQDNPHLFVLNLNDPADVKAITRYRSSKMMKIKYIAGKTEDTLVLAGREMILVNLKTLKLEGVARGFMRKLSGRPSLMGDIVLVPTSREFRKFSVLRRRALELKGWKEGTKPGNIFVLGNYLLVLTNDYIALYKGISPLHIDDPFKHNPIDLDELYSYCEDLVSAGFSERAVQGYLKFITLAEGIKQYEEKIHLVRKKLCWANVDAAREYMKRGDFTKAIDLLEFARKFSPKKGKASVSLALQLARCYEKKKKFKEALLLYQEILENSPQILYPVEDTLLCRLDLHSFWKIESIIKNDKRLREIIDARAGELLKRVKDTKSIKKFLNIYPNSTHARDLMRRLIDAYLEKKPYLAARYTRIYLERYEKDPMLQKRLSRILEELGDLERLKEIVSAKTRKEIQKNIQALTSFKRSFKKVSTLRRILYPVKSINLPARASGFGEKSFLFTKDGKLFLMDLSSGKLLWRLEPRHFGLAGPRQGWIGVRLSGRPPQYRIMEVYPNSPAERAGLKAGDEFSVVGVIHHSAEELKKFIQKNPGKRLQLMVTGRGIVTLTIALEREPPLGMLLSADPSSIIIVWEKGLVKVGLRDGKQKWLFKDEKLASRIISFQMAGDRILLSTQDEQKQRVLCLDELTGRLLWVRELGKLEELEYVKPLLLYPISSAKHLLALQSEANSFKVYLFRLSSGKFNSKVFQGSDFYIDTFKREIIYRGPSEIRCIMIRPDRKRPFTERWRITDPQIRRFRQGVMKVTKGFIIMKLFREGIWLCPRRKSGEFLRLTGVTRDEEIVDIGEGDILYTKKGRYGTCYICCYDLKRRKLLWTTRVFGTGINPIRVSAHGDFTSVFMPHLPKSPRKPIPRIQPPLASAALIVINTKTGKRIFSKKDLPPGEWGFYVFYGKAYLVTKRQTLIFSGD